MVLMAKNILEVKDLSKHFGQLRAVDGLSFHVEKGEILGFMGPNGAGKTTMFNLVMGVYKPTAGQVFYDGHEITNYPTWKRCQSGMGRTYQIPRVLSHMTVYENILVGCVHGARLHGIAAEKKALEVLEITGLSHRTEQIAGSLTLLDRKRLELSKALATSPKLLLIDEVAAGLTEVEGESLVELIKQISREGVTVIWVEHIVKMLFNVVTRLLVVNKGSYLCCGCVEDVVDKKEFQEAYLGVE
jgi:branched-chain amino acid transport system ATP-binding protein